MVRQVYADNVDANGKVFDTVGENIRKGARAGELLNYEEILEKIDALDPEISALQADVLNNSNGIKLLHDGLLHAILSNKYILNSSERWKEYDNDANNLKNNRVYTITYSVDVNNLPYSKFNGFILVVSGDVYSLSTKWQIATRGVNNEIYTRTKWGNTWGEWSRIANKNEIPTIPSKIYPSISMFESIGVIGDSYASGQNYNSGSPVNYYNLSWGQILARRNGIKCINYSKGGLTTKTWLTDDKGLSLMQSSEANGLYIIALGINDNTEIASGNYTLGSSTDFNLSNYNDTPDTFYGNMAKIIGNIKAKSDRAKIVLSTMALNNTITKKQINTAITEISTISKIPMINQSENEYFKSDYYLNGMISNHPTSPVYSGMSKAIQEMIEEKMVTEYEYFKDYVGIS